ncbi:hypothetical protein [Nocardioides pantholopis]|uniref:hypothetical protein n=1 Tax=Nocardioides pantholopis TaxID=2483798 RepID=UPI0013DDF230|nr:hypothetical protein [Nocardioides pantholopis]
MSEPVSTRPRQVTMSAWLIMGGSMFVVVSVFEQVAGISSLRTREAVEDFLAEPPGDGLGLGVEGVLDLLRTMAMVAGACAAAALVLGYQVLQRSRSARVVLSVLAVPLFISGLVAGGFMSSVVAAAVAMLWLQPARDWFAGIDRPAPRSVQAERSAAPVWPPPVQQPQTERPQVDRPHADRPGEQASAPRPWAGYGTAPSQAQAPYAGPAGAQRADLQAASRPAVVLWACVLTWSAAGVVGGLMLLTALVMAAAPDPIFDEMLRQRPDLLESAEMTQDQLVSAVLVVAALVVVWCAAVSVVAVLAFRRVRWARVALVVSAALAGLVCLAGTLTGSIVLAVPFLACVATVALLSRPESRSWFTAARGSMNS